MYCGADFVVLASRRAVSVETLCWAKAPPLATDVSGIRPSEWETSLLNAPGFRGTAVEAPGRRVTGGWIVRRPNRFTPHAVPTRVVIRKEGIAACLTPA